MLYLKSYIYLDLELHASHTKTWNLRLEDCPEFKVSLSYIASYRLAKAYIETFFLSEGKKKKGGREGGDKLYVLSLKLVFYINLCLVYFTCYSRHIKKRDIPYCLFSNG